MSSSTSGAQRPARAAEDRLTELVRARGPALVGYAYLLVGEKRAAEDLVQDAFVKVFVRLRDGSSPVAMEAYVRRTILTLHVDSYRRSRRWAAVRHLFATPERDDQHADAEQAKDIRSALGHLSPQERTCIVLRYFDDLTVPQTAERMGLHPGTVKRYLHHAVTKLESLLGPLEDGSTSHDDDLTVLPLISRPTTRSADS